MSNYTYCGFALMSAPRTELWQQILDGIFWGSVGALSGGAYGSLMGGMGGLVVGGSIGILKFGWIALDVTIIRGNRLSFTDAQEMSCEVLNFAVEGARIGGLILGSITGVSYGVYLAYLMIERSTERSRQIFAQ